MKTERKSKYEEISKISPIFLLIMDIIIIFGGENVGNSKSVF